MIYTNLFLIDNLPHPYVIRVGNDFYIVVFEHIIYKKRFYIYSIKEKYKDNFCSSIKMMHVGRREGSYILVFI